MSTTTMQEIATKKQDRLRFESDVLENASHEARVKRVNEVKDTVREYLNATRLNGSSVLDSMVFDLFNAAFDSDSAVWALEDDSISLLKELTNPKLAEIINPNILERSIDMLYRLNRFAAGLKEDYRIAELHLAFVEYDGEGNIYNSLNVEHDYKLKMKSLSMAFDAA